MFRNLKTARLAEFEVVSRHKQSEILKIANFFSKSDLPLELARFSVIP